MGESISSSGSSSESLSYRPCLLRCVVGRLSVLAPVGTVPPPAALCVWCGSSSVEADFLGAGAGVSSSLLLASAIFHASFGGFLSCPLRQSKKYALDAP